MRHRFAVFAISFVLVAVLAGSFAWSADELKPIQLPAPKMEGGKPLMQALKDRHTTRDFATDTLSLQMLSNLLWAADGINRPEDGKRTAPSAMNIQETDIYVALASGFYLYQAKENVLKPVLAQDVRAKTGSQPFVGEAALNLVYVADYAKMTRGSEEDKDLYAAADVGFIAQNVYLFCSSENLACVVRGSVDRKGLAELVKLRPEQKIILAQTVGYPKK